MSISEILQNVTVLKDCTEANVSALILMVLGFLAALINAFIFIKGFDDIDVVAKIGTIVIAVWFALGGAFNAWFYSERPAFIDFYISANDVEIQQITEYFKVSEINEIGDTIVCHIEPKSEYYDVVTIYWSEVL